MFSQEEYMIITKLDTAPGARSIQLLTEKPDMVSLLVWSFCTCCSGY